MYINIVLYGLLLFFFNEIDSQFQNILQWKYMINESLIVNAKVISMRLFGHNH